MSELHDTIRNAASPDEKADAVERMLWDHCRSPEGLVYSFTMADELRRPTFDDVLTTAGDPGELTEDDLRYNDERLEIRRIDGKPQYLLQRIPIEDVEAYEDSMLGTGQLLSALCYRYLATLDSDVLDRAAETFSAMYSLYELGLEDQPGWLPKPYGFQCTKQTSPDNQSPFCIALLRYYRIAPPDDRSRITRLLTDTMDYWIRNRYRIHHPYFGLEVDYTTERFYPGHWPLLFLPLCYGVWRITGEPRYEREYGDLVARLDIEPGADPEYLHSHIRAFHRWYYQYGALLELGAEPREVWLRGLSYQDGAIDEEEYLFSGAGYDIRHHVWMWLTPKHDADRERVLNDLMSQTVETFRYRWPEHHRPIAPLRWRSEAMYCFKTTNWLELFRRGRMRGDW